MSTFEASRGEFPSLCYLSNFLKRCRNDMSAYQERDESEGWHGGD